MKFNWFSTSMVVVLIWGLALLPRPVRASGLEFAVDQMPHMVGVAVGMVPDYEGSDNYKFAVAPYLKLRLKGTQRYLLVKGYEMQANVLNHPWLRFGPSLNYRFGRDDDVDDEVVSKMKEIDDTVEAGGFVGIELIDDTNIRKRFLADIDFLGDVGDEHKGYTVTFSARGWYPVTRVIDYGASFSVTYADREYMKTYFGVDERDAAATGLPIFSADAGVKDFRINQMVLYHFNRNWHVGAGVQYRRLLTDAADSPVVDDRGSEHQWLGGIGIGYSW